MEFLSSLQKSALLNLSHVGTLQNEVRNCNLRAEGTHMCTFLCIWTNQTVLHNIQNCKGNIHCSQKGQPSHAAVEGEESLVLNNQLCITKSTDVVLVSLYSIIAL